MLNTISQKGYKIRFDSNVPELFQSGEPYFVSDLNVMSNEQIPSLVVEKPEQDDLADTAATMMPLINGLADLQGYITLNQSSQKLIVANYPHLFQSYFLFSSA